MPNTDALTYVMYKSMRGTLVDVQTSLEGTLHKEVTRISDKGKYFSQTQLSNLLAVNGRITVLLSPLVSSLKDGSSQNIPDKSKGL